MKSAAPGSGDVVLCVGEALIALTPPIGGALEDTDILEVSAAGAEANVAVHLSRLGMSVRFAGAVGRDPLGHRLVATLTAEGVDTSCVLFHETLPTGLYLKNPTDSGTAVHYYRTGSAATRLQALPEPALDRVGHVHVTGITPAISPSCRALSRSILTSTSYGTSFDVNYRPALWTVEEAAPVLRDLADRASVTFVGLDEARLLWGAETPDEVRSLLATKELVVKNGEEAAHAFAGSCKAVVPALRVPVQEPVGAGDAFAAGYLASRRHGGDLATALRCGHALAAGALSARGDQGDLPDPELIAMAHSGHGWPDA
jgi:2-dehydro-3-deoxygluconokinase